MASLKKIGFFQGEEKVTIVEFDKNSPHLVASSPLSSKSNAASPFSSSLTEEIQITSVLQKMLQDNQITGGSFYLSLPMKEIILRSFIIPSVKHEDIQNAVKFESKKYLPFDIQDLSTVFYTTPVPDDKNKHLQVIFFAVRKEVLARYERIFKQVNAEISYCEPYMVSLTKALLFRKEIKPTEHLAFLVLEKNIGRICFIDQGIPQFIREFTISQSSQPDDASSPPGETDESPEALNLKIINEVGNSFDFYARQFSGDRIENMLVSSDFVQKDLLKSLETEIKLKIKKLSFLVTTGMGSQSNDMDAIYAMGACIAPPIDALSGFNFLGGKASKSRVKANFSGNLEGYKESIFLFLICAAVLAAVYFYFQMQIKVVQRQYDQAAAQQGEFLNTPVDSLQTDLQQSTDKLSSYKNIRTKSDIALILFRVASHLPKGAMLTELSVNYDQSNPNNQHVTIDIRGDVVKEDVNEQIAIVNQVFSDFKNDKELSKFINSVTLSSLNLEVINGRKATGFNIHFS